jgi:two-component system CheB/CheR fusion protein
VTKASVGEPPAPVVRDDLLSRLVALLDMEAGIALGSDRRRALGSRVSERMAALGMDDIEAYLALLRASPHELGELSSNLAPDAGAFLRSPALSEALRAAAVPRWLARGATEVRAWVIGCGSGDDAYSIALLLFESFERVKVFATEPDPKLLEAGRNGTHPRLRKVSRARVLRHFDCSPDLHRDINRKLHEAVVFAAHNVLSDPPFSRLDLIFCPGLLRYTGAGVQHKLRGVLHFALKEDGYLLLDPGEPAGLESGMFEPVPGQRNMFRRISTTARKAVAFPIVFDPPRPHNRAERPERPLAVADLARQQLLGLYAPASILIDRRREVLYFHGAVHYFLRHPHGEATTDVLALARDGLRAELSATIRQAFEDHETVMSRDVWIDRDAEQVAVRMIARPSPAFAGSSDLMLISFEHAARSDGLLAATSSRSDQAIALRYDAEMEALRAELQSTIAELARANEQLVAANQDLSSVNIELEHTNAALAQAKQELESLNAELAATNDELEGNMRELEASHDDMANLLVSTEIATVFLTLDLVIKRYTPAATRLFKFIPSDVGRPISDITSRFDCRALAEDVAGVVRQRAQLDREVCTQDGHWYMQRATPYRTAAGSIEGVVLAYIDIDPLKRVETELRRLSANLEKNVEERTQQLSTEVQERRRTEEILRSERNFVAAVVSTVSALIVVLDTQSRIVRFNRACEKASGYTFEDVAGKEIRELQLFSPEDMDAVGRDLLELRSGFRRPIASERPWRHRDGATRLISWSTTALANGDGAVEFVIATGIDVTEQRRAEDQARLRLVELTALHRLHTVGELGGIFAHEINQPLAAIAAHSEAGLQRLRRADAAPESAIEDFKHISNQAQRAGTIIKTLRSFLAKDSGETVAIDVCVVVEAACRLVTAEARTNRVSVVVDCAEGLPPILAEPAKVEHVLINLIRNGIEAIRDTRAKKGSIKVSTAMTGDGMACITVVDSGPGLDELRIETIFEPFNSTKAEGLGLGLVISRSLVEQAGGRLWAEARRNAGVFHFTVPLAS